MRIRIPIWSRLTRLQRILLGVVVAIVALYVFAVGLGARSGAREGGLAEPPGFVRWMGDLFASPSRVDPADLTTDCQRPPPGPSPAPSPAATPQADTSPSAAPEPSPSQRDVLVVPQACVLTVAPREGDLRQLTVHALDAVRIEAPLPREDGTAVKNLAVGEDVSVTVDAEGAQIRIACLGPPACFIELR